MPVSIGLLAHSSQEEALTKWVDANKAGLKGLEIVTTSGLAELFELSYRGEDLTIRGEHTLREGFDIELASMAHRGDLAGLIFFIDPAALNQAVPNLNMLLEACHVKDIPVALNAASAELCLRGIAHSRVAYLIFNPVAGQGNPAQELALIRSILEPRILVNVVMTQRDVDPADQARDIVKTIKARNQSGEGPGTTMIIASGGDGTVSAVAGATIGSDVPLGIIPRGTANAFSVALGIPTDLAGACRNILNGNTRVVDGAQCNDTPMILLAGLGFEAGMVARATREKKDRLGCLAYVLAGVETFFQGEPFQATIEVEGEVHELTVAAITVANVAPPTSMLAQGAGEVIPDDGLLDVTVGIPTSAVAGLGAMASLFTAAVAKTPTQRDDILFMRTKSIKVTASPAQPLVIDGEIVDANPIVFECIPKGLTVFAPLPTI